MGLPIAVETAGSRLVGNELKKVKIWSRYNLRNYPGLDWGERVKPRKTTVTICGTLVGIMNLHLLHEPKSPFFF